MGRPLVAVEDVKTRASASRLASVPGSEHHLQVADAFPRKPRNASASLGIPTPGWLPEQSSFGSSPLTAT